MTCTHCGAPATHRITVVHNGHHKPTGEAVVTHWCADHIGDVSLDAYLALGQITGWYAEPI